MSDTAERVKKIVVEHLGVEADKVTEAASFIDDLGADSLDTVELVMAFEEEFGVEIPDDAAETILTVGDAVEVYRQGLRLTGALRQSSPCAPERPGDEARRRHGHGAALPVRRGLRARLEATPGRRQRRPPRHRVRGRGPAVQDRARHPARRRQRRHASIPKPCSSRRNCARSATSSSTGLLPPTRRWPIPAGSPKTDDERNAPAL